MTSRRLVKRPLALCLLAGLLFEGCVLAGVLASPFFREWMPRSRGAADDAMALLARWRESMARPADDPRPGAPAPPLRLVSLAGQPIRPADLRGKKVALLFAKEGGG